MTYSFRARWRPVSTLAACLLLLACAHPAAADSGNTSERYIARADSSRLEGAYEIELSALHHARGLDSADVEVLWRLSRAYVELGELATEKSQKRKFYEAAMGHGQAAIVADSQSCIAYTWLSIAEGVTANVVDFKQRVKLAWLIRDHALKAIELDPESDIAYHVMARWHAEIASIGGFRRAMANLLFGDLPQASYEESIAYYQRAIELHDQIHHRLELAKVYIRMDENVVAQEKLEDVLAMHSEKRLDDRYKNEARLLLAHLQ